MLEVPEVPEVVRAKARDVGAGAWLADLPALIADLAGAWGLEVGEPYRDATEAYVVGVTTTAEGEAGPAGTPAVLKVLVPRSGDAARHEITVLRRADGDGCVRLLRADEDRDALLLERLGPSLHELGLPLATRLDLLVAAAARVWRPAPDAGLPTGAEKGRWLAEHIARRWDELDRPCSRRAVDHALACAERRTAAHDDERAVLVHGDVHQWNALRAGVGVRLIDPDGLLAEPEYDLGVLLREDPVALRQGDPRDRARLLAARTGCDVEAAWEWGVVERVSTGLLATAVGLQPVGREMLATADHVARTAG